MERTKCEKILSLEKKVDGCEGFLGQGIEGWKGWKGWTDCGGGLYHVQSSTKGVWRAHVCS